MPDTPRKKAHKRLRWKSRRRWLEPLVAIVGRCYWCHHALPLPNGDATIDHLVAVSKGGSSDINNVVLCCHRCNAHKKDGESCRWGHAMVHHVIRKLRSDGVPLHWKTVLNVITKTPARKGSTNVPTIGEGLVKEAMRHPENDKMVSHRTHSFPGMSPFEPMVFNHGYDDDVLQQVATYVKDKPIVKKKLLETSLNVIWPNA